jgi:thioredoxin 1
MSEAHNVTIVTAENFEAEVIQAREPVIVEFWTEGCQPCRKLGTVIRQYLDRLKVAPCNVDENSELAERYGVRTIPTLLFFKNGSVVDQAMGTFNDINEAEVAEKCARLIGA